MAAELRVLAAGTGTNKPLLLDLMDESQFEYRVAPYQSDSLGVIPIVRVDQLDQYDAVLDRATKAQRKDNAEEFKKAIEERERLVRDVPLREFIEHTVAAVILGSTWTWKDLILNVAQQMGSAHEDDSVVPELEKARTFRVSGPRPLTSMPTHVRFLGEVAGIVLRAGKAFLEERDAARDFKARHSL